MYGIFKFVLTEDLYTYQTYYYMKELKKVGVLSAGKITAIFMLLLGAIVSIVMIIITLAVLIFSIATGSYGPLFVMIGVLFMVLIGVVGYTAVGFIMGIIYAAIYNFIARKWGGLKIELV